MERKHKAHRVYLMTNEEITENVKAFRFGRDKRDFDCVAFSPESIALIRCYPYLMKYTYFLFEYRIVCTLFSTRI